MKKYLLSFIALLFACIAFSTDYVFADSFPTIVTGSNSAAVIKGMSSQLGATMDDVQLNRTIQHMNGLSSQGNSQVQGFITRVNGATCFTVQNNPAVTDYQFNAEDLRTYVPALIQTIYDVGASIGNIVTKGGKPVSSGNPVYYYGGTGFVFLNHYNNEQYFFACDNKGCYPSDFAFQASGSYNANTNPAIFTTLNWSTAKLSSGVCYLDLNGYVYWTGNPNHSWGTGRYLFAGLDMNSFNGVSQSYVPDSSQVPDISKVPQPVWDNFDNTNKILGGTVTVQSGPGAVNNYLGDTVVNNYFTVTSPVPVTPSLLGKVISSSEIDLSWQSVANASEYKVFDNNNNLIYDGSDTHFNINNLSPNTVYSYDLVAVSNGGSSSPSVFTGTTFGNSAPATTDQNVTSLSGYLSSMYNSLTTFMSNMVADMKNVLQGSAGLVTFLTGFFSWLPYQVVDVMVIGFMVGMVGFFFRR